MNEFDGVRSTPLSVTRFQMKELEKMANDNLLDPEQEPTQKLTPFERTVLQRFDQINVRLDHVDERFNQVDERFNQVDERFNQVDERLNQVDERLNNLEAKALDTKPIWDQALAEILNVKAEVVEIKDELQRFDGALETLAGALVKMRADLQGFNRRISALDKARPVA